MNELATKQSLLPAAGVPEPKIHISVRPGTDADIPFIDALQKSQSKALGFMHDATLRGKIRLNEVLIAERIINRRGTENAEKNIQGEFSSDFSASSASSAVQPIGYVIGGDRYCKRDELGIIYQMNVDPKYQRSYVAAALLKAQFEKSAYGCKLYCCWCAKDLAHANAFWENMGFAPIAFRAGSNKKARVHIFWMKRIREGDTTTPFWYPSKTEGGAMREDRVVLPIPAGTHWSDVHAPEFPGLDGIERREGASERPESLTVSQSSPVKKVREKRVSVPKRNAVRKNGLWYDIPQPGEKLPMVVEKTESTPKEKVKVKLDPRLKEAARELRDRWTEEVSAGRLVIESAGKYNVARQIESTSQRANNNHLLAA